MQIARVENKRISMTFIESYELKGNEIKLMRDDIFGYVLVTDDILLCSQSFQEASRKMDEAIKELNPIPARLHKSLQVRPGGQ
jgi:hypothetical protein